MMIPGQLACICNSLVARGSLGARSRLLFNLNMTGSLVFVQRCLCIRYYVLTPYAIHVATEQILSQWPLSTRVVATMC